MRFTTSQAALLALPALINAVSLSDMKPRAENLPSACNKIYDSQISGCGVSDFTQQTCTETCISGLQAMVDPIQDSCSGYGVTGSNLVVAFLAGVGPQQICKNAPAESGEEESSSSATQQSTPSPSPTPTSTVMTTPSSTQESTTTSETETLIVDTESAASPTRRPTPKFSGTRTASSLNEEATTTRTSAMEASASPSQTNTVASTDSDPADDGSETDNERTGGGSPFDEEGNMYSNGADSLSSTSVLISLGIAFIIVVFLFR